jgi:hypothetical protein
MMSVSMAVVPVVSVVPVVAIVPVAGPIVIAASVVRIPPIIIAAVRVSAVIVSVMMMAMINLTQYYGGGNARGNATPSSPTVVSLRPVC